MLCARGGWHIRCTLHTCQSNTGQHEHRDTHRNDSSQIYIFDVGWFAQTMAVTATNQSRKKKKKIKKSKRFVVVLVASDWLESGGDSAERAKRATTTRHILNDIFYLITAFRRLVRLIFWCNWDGQMGDVHACARAPMLWRKMLFLCVCENERMQYQCVCWMFWNTH